MISEPELEGEWATGRPAEDARPDAPTAPPRGRRAPWVWALGGMVLASAVWAGTLAVRERSADAGPPIRYRHSEQLCTETPLKAVGAVAGGFGVGMPSHAESAALDWSYCFSTGGKGESPFTHEGQVLVELHKKADPEVEFGSGPDVNPYLRMPSVPAEQVPGLGERATFTGQQDKPRLQVLDGGAVFTMTVTWWGDVESEALDEDAVKSAMIEDMRALMARLRR
ncbi:hypothetical protein OOK31_12325 [Streptomyces sp. NBC_00249]|uniref:hypothetical protein n=1 Tax=Streptomyces sp. NBC_00249 TaxID=2975690 RepID=UPI002259EE4C|nr:hypothetical protein [Streptomyces sp. NBC_00249]MCX5194673.1 hypothetical protein [Streptomyces sp. NBC_00249]